MSATSCGRRRRGSVSSLERPARPCGHGRKARNPKHEIRKAGGRAARRHGHRSGTAAALSDFEFRASNFFPGKGVLTFRESSYRLRTQFKYTARGTRSPRAPLRPPDRIGTESAPTDGTLSHLAASRPPAKEGVLPVARRDRETRTMTPPAAPDPLAVYPASPAGRDAVVVAAPAKLNLFLEVLGKRPDGYHDLESLMVAVDLFDTLEVRPGRPGVIALTCDPPGLPTGPDNLVVKAANTLRTRAGRPELGAEIRLTKRIPPRAGLAGGSADAALTLLALNQIWKLALTRIELA